MMSWLTRCYRDPRDLPVSSLDLARFAAKKRVHISKFRLFLSFQKCMFFSCHRDASMPIFGSFMLIMTKHFITRHYCNYISISFSRFLIISQLECVSRNHAWLVFHHSCISPAHTCTDVAHAVARAYSGVCIPRIHKWRLAITVLPAVVRAFSFEVVTILIFRESSPSRHCFSHVSTTVSMHLREPCTTGNQILPYFI